MEWKSAQEFIGTVGLPTAMVLGGAYAVWKFAIFLGPLIKEWFQKQGSLMQSLEHNLQTQTQNGEHVKLQLAGLHDKIDVVKEIAIRRRCHAAPDSDLYGVDPKAGPGSGIHH